MLVVAFFSGCDAKIDGSGDVTPVEDNQKVWGDYVESSNIKYTDNNGNVDDVPPIALDDIGFNVVGLPREIANNLDSARQYHELWLHLNEGYYSNIRDGEDVEDGSVKVEDYTDSGNHLKIDFKNVFNTLGNENVKIGDEVLKIDIYSDPNHKFLIETFNFIL